MRFLVGFITLVILVFSLMRSFEQQDYYVITYKSKVIVLDESWLQEQRSHIQSNKEVKFNSELFIYVSIIFIFLTSVLGTCVCIAFLLPYVLIRSVLKALFRKWLFQHYTLLKPLSEKISTVRAIAEKMDLQKAFMRDREKTEEKVMKPDDTLPRKANTSDNTITGY